MDRSGRRPARRRTARDRLARRGDLRLVRGTLVGLSVLGLAAAGHAVAGGPVQPTPLLVAALACVAAGVALSDREWRAGRLVAALAAGQLAVHLLLSVGSGSAHHGSAGLLRPDAAMLAWHLVALAATVVVLRRGEQVLLGVAAALSSPLFGHLRLPYVPPPVTVRATSPDPVGWAASPLRHCVVRRGPPVAA